jgi:hypothetical protein
MKHSEPLLARLDRFQQRALIIGAVGLIACVAGIFIDTPQLIRSWLYGFIVWIAIPVGAFGIYMLHNLVGGAWGFLIRRLLSAAIRTLPLMFVLFIPVIIDLLGGNSVLYPWARPEAAQDHVLHAKASYLNEVFWIVRSILYFAIWIGWSAMVFRRVRRLEESGEITEIRKIQNVSAGGLVLLMITMTFAAVDWIMSLEPHWFSTIFGVQQVVAFALATICAATLLLTYLADYRPISDVMRPKIFHDLGTLMFAFNMLWAYLTFSQLLIIYGGNLAEETPWYLHRLHGGWEWIAYSLIALHFATPFVILLSRRNKRSTTILRTVAIWLLVMRAVDFLWIIAPSFHQTELHVHWLDLAAVIGIGGIFVWYFLYQIKQRPLLLTNDPRMQAALAHVEEKEPLLMVAEEDLEPGNGRH